MPRPINKRPGGFFMAGHPNSFGARSTLTTEVGSLTYYSLNLLEKTDFSGIDRLPFSIRILLENLLRNEDGVLITSRDIENMALWGKNGETGGEVPFMPARVLLQDFTGVPAIVDLAAMRDAAQRLYGDCSKINPLIPAELVIDHSVQVDVFGSPDAVSRNAGIRLPAEFRTVCIPEVGAEMLSQFQRGAAGHRDLPPGESGIPGQRGLRVGRTIGHGSVSGHGCGPGFPHHHDQRTGRSGLGSRRH